MSAIVKRRLCSFDTKYDVTGGNIYTNAEDVLRVFHDNPGSPTFECGTTYEVTVGGRGKRAVTSVSGLPITGVPEGVPIEKGAANWTFTTEPCT